jgi:asparagine synthetase B (glutamine-hydrolysing)
MLQSVRFCGNYSWKHAVRPPILAPSHTLLGANALEWSPPGGERMRLGLWSPGGEAPEPRHVASVAGITVVFAGYLRDLSAGYPGEAAYVLDRYRAGDHAWINSANGVFAFAVVDEDADRCLLGADRLGMRPLYYSHDDQGVTFSGTMAAAIPWGRTRPQPDYDTLQELMVLGFPLTNRTFLRGVERIAPGTVVDVRSARRQIHRYWSLDRLPRIRSQALESFVDESQRHLRHALTRLLERAPTPTLCLLSSGYDSRRLLLEASAIGGRLDAVTAVWPYPAKSGFTIDPGVTSELCRRLGVPHRIVAAPADARQLRSARGVRDLLLDFQVFGRDHIWAVPLIGSLQSSDPRVNLDGLCGDTFFNNPFYSLPRSVWGRWRPDREVLDAIAPTRDLEDARWRALTSSSLANRIEGALDALPEDANRLSFFYLLGRTRAVVSLLPYGMLDERVESLCPYLDNDVMEHALSLDPISKGEGRLQGVALRRHFSAFADIPSSHSPASEVPAAYLAPHLHADPIRLGRFTSRDVRDLLLPWRSGARLCSVDPRDLIFATLSMIGVDHLGGSWREPRLRDRLQALRAFDLLRGGDVRRVVAARALASRSLAQ